MGKLILILVITGIVAALILLIIYLMKDHSSSTPGPSTPAPSTPGPDDTDYPMLPNYCDSGCNKPGGSPQFFMCPDLILGSDALFEAAEKDGNDWAYYALATHVNDKGGRCYQISYLPYCGKYWAEDESSTTGPICCGDKCNYSTPYDCFQSQLSHCC
jgi:hypothetical protein